MLVVDNTLRVWPREKYIVLEKETAGARYFVIILNDKGVILMR